jgi:hypothetical protein
MKKLAFLTLSLLLTVTVAACATAISESPTEAINPGDKVGDFVIRAGDEANLANSEEINCSKQEDEEKYICEVMVGKDLNVSLGVYDDQYSGKLEELWSKHTYDMTINDRPVNLQAFGSIDQQHPSAGMMRYWNVVIAADKPGEITVHSKGSVGNKPFEDTSTYVFIAP